MNQEELISDLKNLLNYEKLNNYLRNRLINLNTIPFQAILKERKVLSYKLGESEIISVKMKYILGIKNDRFFIS